MLKRKTIMKLLSYLFWISIGSGLTVLLVGAVQKEQLQQCTNVVVEFTDHHNFRMLDEAEIAASLFPSGSTGFPVGKRLARINLFALEKQLEKNPWVKSADLFFDHQQVLHIQAQQRKPVARLFSPEGNSFYLDEEFAVLPIKSLDVIQLPVFTNFYPTPAGYTLADTLLMKRVIGLAKFILADSFWMAQVEQVNINADQSFELYTQVGDQLVKLGVRQDWDALFNKLKLLYAKISKDNGWGKYSSIDLQYKDQAVCIRKENLIAVPDSSVLPIADTLSQQINTENKQLINPVKIAL
jgi:cell division protein FtsQ